MGCSALFVMQNQIEQKLSLESQSNGLCYINHVLPSRAVKSHMQLCNALSYSYLGYVFKGFDWPYLSWLLDYLTHNHLP